MSVFRSLLPTLLAILAGAAMSAQPGVNALLARRLGSPLLAATASFVVGTLALVPVTLAIDGLKPVDRLVPLPGPWWIWTGGLLGMLIVTGSIVLAPRLGATTWTGLFLAGQVLTALLLDQLGLAGFEARPISPVQVAGAALLLAGVFLIRMA